MTCTKCNSELSYGTKYCEVCGEKIDTKIYEEEYNKTIWAKFDNLKDKYDTFFLKKITGNIVFKIVWLVLVLVYFFFTMYGTLNGIRLKESDSYIIQYYEKGDEYFIRPNVANTNLEMYVPIGTETITFAAYKDGAEAQKTEFTTDEYQEQGYSITAGEYEYINIEAKKGDKVKDTVKVIVKE